MPAKHNHVCGDFSTREILKGKGGKLKEMNGRRDLKYFKNLMNRLAARCPFLLTDIFLKAIFAGEANLHGDMCLCFS